MAWSRFDDSWVDHPKVIKAGNEAVGLFTRAVTWSSRHLTDGVVPIGVITMMAGSVKRANFLVKVLFDVGLLDHCGNESVTIHDYLEYNPSRGDVHEKRQHIHEVRRRAGEAGGKQSGSKRQANAKQRSSPDSTKQNRSPVPVPVPVPNRTRTEPPLYPLLPDRSLTLAEVDDGFSRFWAAYPRKDGKKAAVKAWQKLRPSPSLQERLLEAVAHQRGTPQWSKDDGQFIPHPATFLNGERWTDEGAHVNGYEDLRQFLVDRAAGQRFPWEIVEARIAAEEQG